MNYELQVLLGLNCNFSCGHCLNSSGPGNRDFDISDNDIDLLISTVEKNSSIKIISFSGGEPLLYLPKIEVIVSRIRAFNSDVKFSITTNGSLVEKSRKSLNEIKINYAILSFDQEHAKYISADNFIEAMRLSLDLFESFEINITYAESPHYQPIKKFLLENNIKVNFTQEIASGRSAFVSASTVQLTSFVCPNIGTSTKSEKITFIPNKGFTICCGPVVFDKVIEDSNSYFLTFEDLRSNLLFKFLKRVQSVQVSTNKAGGCASCKEALSSVNNGELKFFTEKSGWDNVIYSWDAGMLEHYNKLFNPKIIKKVEVGAFSNYLANLTFEGAKDFKKIEGDNLPESDIEAFSQFTIESFYDVHQLYYSIGDIVRFKNDQKVFFNLPNKYVYHLFEGKIVGYLAVCMIETHPFLKTKAWHIGYWGLMQGLEKIDRDAIKKDWANLLQSLNQDSVVAANIDYFNTPADRLSAKFNFKPMCVRLDTRQ